MTFPWYRMSAPPEWCCPNCRRGLKDVECWCGRQRIEATPRPSSVSQTQQAWRSVLKKEPYEQMRERLLKQGQRQLKSQGEYLLQHMGLSDQQLRVSREVRPWTSSSTRSSSGSELHVPMDPVMSYMMHGPPAYSPTLAALASAAL